MDTERHSYAELYRDRRISGGSLSHSVQGDGFNWDPLYLNAAANSQCGRFLHAQMREGDGQRVRCVRIRRFRQTEKSAHHERHLVLSGCAAPDGRLFDAFRRIFENR